MVHRLIASRDATQRISTLRGIANSAYVGALDAIKTCLLQDDALVRSAAVESLRLMQHPEVDPLIAARMTDKQANVRNAALATASYRTPTETLATAVGKMATTTPDAYGRMEAVKVIATWLQQRKELRAVLDQVVQKDPEPRIRHAAQKALQG